MLVYVINLPSFEYILYKQRSASPVKEIAFDLIILGSSIRMVIGQFFFGHRVDAILNKAHCPVAVITAPRSL
jgi:nucleotide-binding universal stress UspA family protein